MELMDRTFIPAAGTLGQSDWTRYASRRYAPTMSQMAVAPLTITLTALIGWLSILFHGFLLDPYISRRCYHFCVIANSWDLVLESCPVTGRYSGTLSFLASR